MTKKKYSIENDPNKQAEAQKYDDPIPSRPVILKFLKDNKHPSVFDNIARALNLYRSKQLDALANRLGAMIRDEQIIQDGGFFSLIDQQKKILAGYIRLEHDGSGTITTENKKQSAFLPPTQAKLVFNGDKVYATLVGINRKGKLEARIDSIIQRGTHEIIGRYNEVLDSQLIRPINKTLPKNIVLIPVKEQLEPDTLIKAKIVSYPSPFSPAVAQYISVIEEQSPVLTAISIASKKHNLIEQWSDKTLKLIKRLAKQVNENEVNARIDLRELPFVTIDGEDAKDFDDAVFARKSSTGGWKLYVAIADVSYYVKPNSALDNEAQQRSTSVYFPGYVIPMLPEALSNELCSLKPNVDRLSLVCEMNVSKTGRLSRYKFYSAVINSKARLTYTEVGNLLQRKDTSIYSNHPELVPHLYDLYDLYKVLHAGRVKRGAIDFDTIETQIILDKHQHISSITPRQRNDAHRLIEECMLLANVATAKFIEKNKAVSPFRVHHSPPSAKVEDLKAYLRTLGINFNHKKNKVTPEDYAQMLDAAEHREDFNNIQLMSLKSMNQAIYTPDNEGHFGLAYPAYTHFTSPIRRYPDLLTHRVIKAIINEKKFGAKSYTHAQLDELCAHASSQERNADGASMDVEKWLKCHFLHNRIGENFSGKIVHVTGFGMYIELEGIFIEGLVHISSMHGDYYIFDETHHRLIGKNSHKAYGIGQQVEAQLVRVSLDDKQIDFELTETQQLSQNNRKSSARSRHSQKRVRVPHSQKKNNKSRLKHSVDIEPAKSVNTKPNNKKKKQNTKHKKANAKTKLEG